ncbi:MAG: hypothetical protein ACRYGL_13800 [Janthinobacterium lividum]
MGDDASPIFRPAADAQQPEMSSDGRGVTYRFADAWSLITLINRHRTTESGAGTDARSQTLAFEFPVSVNHADGAAPSLPGERRARVCERRARVFARVTLFEAGKKQALVWPGIIPGRAPGWTGSGGD